MWVTSVGEIIELEVDSRRRIVLPPEFKGVRRAKAVFEGSLLIISRNLEDPVIQAAIRAIGESRRKYLENWAKDFEELGEISVDESKRLLQKASRRRAEKI